MSRVLYSIVLFSCATAPPPDYSDVKTTALEVTFSIDADVADKIEGPVAGMFYGRAFGADEVGPLGPQNNAVEVGAIEVEVELSRDGSPTEVLARLEDVPAVEIAILGFVDIDDNADPAAPDPNKGDPVTLPDENKFEVAEGENLIEVFFGLLKPF